MPNNRHQKHHRQRDEDAHNNNNQQPAVAVSEAGAGQGMGHQQRQNDNAGARLQHCCSPGSCRYPDETIDPDDPYDAVKVACNNENCTEGTWMHKDCFEDFEQSVLAYLRSCGRARSWSEKQRLQNLWTKKGYDLAFKACDCKCGRGHLRKDLDYIPPPINDNAKKHRKNKKKNDKPMPVVSTTHKSNSHNSHVGPLAGTHHSNANQHQPAQVTAHSASTHAVHVTGGKSVKRKNSITTTSTTKSDTVKTDNDHVLPNQENGVDNQTTSTAASTTAVIGMSTTCNNFQGTLPTTISSQIRLRTNSMSSVGSVGSHASSISSVPSSAGSASPISASPVSGEMFFKGRKSSDASFENGPATVLGFRQRQDLSAFANLPRYKQNPYHIRMEDASTLACAFAACTFTAGKPQAQWELAEAGSCDVETRNFVLSNLLSKRTTSTRCVLCKTPLPVFDRFPLIDGTFFLSPQSYDESAIQVIWDGRLQFLNAACLGCLEGKTDVKCVACKQRWDGRNLVVGSMYTYDIFVSTPCCQKRLTCKCCRRAVVDISMGLSFYSQYSQMIICPYCKANDYHFIRSLGETFLVAQGRPEFVAMAPICQ